MCAKPVTSVVREVVLELVKLRAVDEARDHLARVVLRHQRRRHDAVEFRRIVGGRDRRACRNRRALAGRQRRDDVARDLQRVMIVDGVVIGDAREARVDIGAAEILGRDVLAGRGLHQRRAAEKNRALPPHDDRLVRHRRHVGAARRARSHDDGDLRDAGGRQPRLIVEDAAEVIAIREHLGPVRQVGAAGIDEIEARQTVFLRDLLRAQMLLHGQRIVGAALDGRVVAHDHALAARNAADAGDHAGAVDVAAVHVIGRELRQLEERRARIDQPEHAVARQQLAAREMALAQPLRSAGGCGGALGLEVGDHGGHRRAVGGEVVRAGIDRCFQPGHGALMMLGAP